MFNDKILKKSRFTFYSYPTENEASGVDNDGTITTAGGLDTTKISSWRHNWDDGVVTTEATMETPGVITYSNAETSEQERKT